MQKKFEINQTKIKGGFQSGRKVVTHNSKSDLPLVHVQVNILFTSFLRSEGHISRTHIFWCTCTFLLTNVTQFFAIPQLFQCFYIGIVCKDLGQFLKAESHFSRSAVVVSLLLYYLRVPCKDLSFSQDEES